LVSAALKLESYPAVSRGERRTEILLRDVALSFASGKGKAKTVLSSLNLEIAAGEFVVVLGETGCGKSTLLRLILGEEFPSGGSVVVDGKSVSRIDSRCGYVPQKYSLFPDKTVLENVMYGPENAKASLLGRWRPAFRRFRRDLRDEARAFLERMGLHTQDLHKYPHQLSGGMQQRVAIAQALLMKPPVLLMDEAFSALDPSTRASLQEQLHAVWNESRPTILFVTHNTQEALLMGTRLVLLRRLKEESQERNSVLLDLEIPTARLPFAARRRSTEFQELHDHVSEMAHRSSSMRDCDENASPVESEGVLQ
jgi:NitT/TauT family transport system ATP-binding protein